MSNNISKMSLLDRQNLISMAIPTIDKKQMIDSSEYVIDNANRTIKVRKLQKQTLNDSKSRLSDIQILSTTDDVSDLVRSINRLKQINNSYRK